MSDSPRQLSLNAFIHPAGHHEAAWRHPWTTPERLFDVTYFQEIARTAEAAKFDGIFFADGPALRSDVEHGPAGTLEPITLLTAIAVATERIGLIATASTTYYEPYNLARLFASLDHISNGRAGWNIVTTGTDLAAANFGLAKHPDHGGPVFACKGNSSTRWCGCGTAGRTTRSVWTGRDGIYADRNKIHEINYVGRHLRVRGPFNAPRTPQGYPVLVQAGASNDGRAFAGQYAEAIFTAHQRLSDAQAFYIDIKSRAAQFGRNPDHVKILPGISPFIGDTEEQAKALEREFNELTSPEYGLAQLGALTGADVRNLELDAPVPVELFAAAGDVTDNKQKQIAGDRRHRRARASDGSWPPSSIGGCARAPGVCRNRRASSRHDRGVVHQRCC